MGAFFLPLDGCEPDDRDQGGRDDADEQRRVKTQKENVTERRVRDADRSERDGRRQDGATDDRRQRVDVDQEHQAPVECMRHLKKSFIILFSIH